MFSWVKMPAECLDKHTKVIVFFKSMTFARYVVLTCRVILLADRFCFVVLCNASIYTPPIAMLKVALLNNYWRIYLQCWH